MGMGMAVTATTAYISGLDFPTPKRITLKKCKFSNSVGFARVGGIRNSTDVSAEAEAESESPVEVSKGPPSLISALNVEKALRGIAITDADHYGRLGIQKGCSYDEVTVAYKKKMEDLMNEGEGEGLDEEELGKRIELLKESHSILSCVEERRLYDWSLARSEKQENRYVWPFEVDITKTTPDSPPPQVVSFQFFVKNTRSESYQEDSGGSCSDYEISKR
ncbi:hypothetical protein F0562_028306 [Nyssa sinensis]|uniref:J domain-containing protein n=1 Tax=Nyssa sinensis TaxID=561372 RepID=A0A5J5B641_9ASTE|nr:hypothetical protein F0562_028306 [Nyssa sinensis]